MVVKTPIEIDRDDNFHLQASSDFLIEAGTVDLFSCYPFINRKWHKLNKKNRRLSKYESSIYAMTRSGFSIEEAIEIINANEDI